MFQSPRNNEIFKEKSTPSAQKFRLPVRPMPSPAQIISSLKKNSLNCNNSLEKSEKTEENSNENKENSNENEEISSKSRENSCEKKQNSCENKENHIENQENLCENKEKACEIIENPCENKENPFENKENANEMKANPNENKENTEEFSEKKPTTSLQKTQKNKGNTKKCYMKTVSFEENKDLAMSHRIQRKLTPYNPNKVRKLPINFEEKALRKKLFATTESKEKKQVNEPKFIDKLRSSCKISLEKLEKESKGKEKTKKSKK